MATSTATFSFLLLLAAISALLAPSSALSFQNCTANPYYVRIAELDVSPDPVRGGGAFTVAVSGDTTDGVAPRSSTDIVVELYNLAGVLLVFRDSQNMYTRGGSDSEGAPGGEPEPGFYTSYETTNLPLTTIVPGSYTLRVLLIDSGVVYVCISATVQLQLPLL